MSHLLSVRNLSRSFFQSQKELHVLHNIDLDIDPGEMVCITGASGAGKSTLLHILGTLDRPTSGQILYDEKPITKLRPRELAKFRNQCLGFVFQFHHLLPEFTAIENVMMPGLIWGGSQGTLKERAMSLMKQVELDHRLHHKPGEMSGGEQQRVALARALLLQPKIILADEPTGNLDSKTSHRVHDLFFEINKKEGTTFVIVTHNLELAKQIPRVITMKDGTILDDEKKAALPLTH